mmetsp:Transcript_84097/g.167845  ORF Transcript_84097/g.167845 Transcript_84097/m.167845 type:complete len:138 (-) Transcript_84097:64-477(-)
MEHVTLVVNCHEANCDVAKYFPHGRKGGKSLEVIAHAVHTWHSFDGTPSVDKNDQIQAAIWAHLQAGNSVAVHCLAGIHRAACIVACHFLYRYHTLGHTHVPHVTDDIYRKLISVRPAVAPAYLHVLQEYEAHVTKK